MPGLFFATPARKSKSSHKAGRKWRVVARFLTKTIDNGESIQYFVLFADPRRASSPIKPYGCVGVDVRLVFPWELPHFRTFVAHDRRAIQKADVKGGATPWTWSSRQSPPIAVDDQRRAMKTAKGSSMRMTALAFLVVVSGGAV